MKQISFLLLIGALTACTNTENVKDTGKQEPLVIEMQGSFAVGGTKFSEPGNFDLANPLNPDGQTFHGDHAYVFYQVPPKARKLPLIFLHGAGQSKKTWETTPTGGRVFRISF